MQTVQSHTIDPSNLNKISSRDEAVLQFEQKRGSKAEEIARTFPFSEILKVLKLKTDEPTLQTALYSRLLGVPVMAVAKLYKLPTKIVRIVDGLSIRERETFLIDSKKLLFSFVEQNNHLIGITPRQLEVLKCCADEGKGISETGKQLGFSRANIEAVLSSAGRRFPPIDALLRNRRQPTVCTADHVAGIKACFEHLASHPTVVAKMVMEKLPTSIQNFESLFVSILRGDNLKTIVATAGIKFMVADSELSALIARVRKVALEEFNKCGTTLGLAAIKQAYLTHREARSACKIFGNNWKRDLLSFYNRQDSPFHVEGNARALDLTPLREPYRRISWNLLNLTYQLPAWYLLPGLGKVPQDGRNLSEHRHPIPHHVWEYEREISAALLPNFSMLYLEPLMLSKLRSPFRCMFPWSDRARLKERYEEAKTHLSTFGVTGGCACLAASTYSKRSIPRQELDNFVSGITQFNEHLIEKEIPIRYRTALKFVYSKRVDYWPRPIEVCNELVEGAMRIRDKIEPYSDIFIQLALPKLLVSKAIKSQDIQKTLLDQIFLRYQAIARAIEPVGIEKSIAERVASSEATRLRKYRTLENAVEVARAKASSLKVVEQRLAKKEVPLSKNILRIMHSFLQGKMINAEAVVSAILGRRGLSA